MSTQSSRLPDGSERSPGSTLPPYRDDGSADADEPIIHLDWYIRAIRRHWLLIFAVAILAGAIGFWYATRQPLRYQGVTTLLVVPPSAPGGAQVNPATFRAIVENASLAAQVISELKLADIEEPMTPLKFLEKALSVEEVRGTNIVKVKVTLNDPRLAAEASRSLAAKAIPLTQQINQQDGASIQAQLKKHLEDAQRRLQTAEKELLTYKQGAQVDLMKEDTGAQLRERGELLRLVVDIEAERARLAAAEAEISRLQPLLSATRIVGAEEALRRAQSDQKDDDARRRLQSDQRDDEARRRLQADQKDNEARRAQPASKGEVDPQHLDLSNPYVNPVYQTLDFQIATTRTRIAALVKERDELVNVKKLGGKELAQLSELYRREIEQARLQANFDLATRVYSDLAVRYEQSRTQPLGSTAQLQVVDEAIPPDRPVARRRLEYLVLGSAVGLVFTVLLVFVWESRGRRF